MAMEEPVAGIVYIEGKHHVTTSRDSHGVLEDVCTDVFGCFCYYTALGSPPLPHLGFKHLFLKLPEHKSDDC